MVDRAKLLEKLSDTPTERVVLEEIGETFIVKGLNAKDLIALQKAIGVRKGDVFEVDDVKLAGHLVCQCVFTEDGERLLEDAAWESALGFAGQAFQKLSVACMRVNGLAASPLENSTPKDGSSSDLPSS